MGGKVPHEKDESVWPLHTQGQRKETRKNDQFEEITHTHTHGIFEGENMTGVRFVEFFSAKCPSLFHSWWTAEKNITISSSRKVWYSSITTRSSSLWNKTWRGVKEVYTQPAKGVHYYYIGFFSFFPTRPFQVSAKSVFDCPFLPGISSS